MIMGKFNEDDMHNYNGSFCTLQHFQYIMPEAIQVWDVDDGSSKYSVDEAISDSDRS